MALGDLLGTGHNVLIVVTTEGNCYLFDVSYMSSSDYMSSKLSEEPQSMEKEGETKTPSHGPPSRKHPSSELTPRSTRTLSANSSSKDPQEDRGAPQEGLQAGTDAPPPLSRNPSGVWTTPRPDSTRPADSSKYPDSSSGHPATGHPSAGKPVVHDDWVSNAPSHHQPGSISTNPTSGTTTPTHAQSRSHDPVAESILDDMVILKGTDTLAPGNLAHGSLSGAGALSGGTGNQQRSSFQAPTLAHSASASGSLNVQSSLNLGLLNPSLNKTTKTEKIEPVYRWFVAGNGTCAIVADVNEDGQCELVVGSSNRVVYCYGIAHEVDAFGAISLKLKLKSKWNVPGQVGSLSLSHDRWGRPILVVAQHGGNYTTIDHRGNSKYREMGVAEPVSHHKASLERNSATQIRHLARQPFDSLGSPQDPVLMAMASLDGAVKLQEENSKMLWTKQTDHQLFALSVVDITGDGLQEIVACSWDGTTYIYDHFGNCVQFQFDERVAAFTAGEYSITKGNKQPCLFFLTFSDHLYIYHNLPITSIPVSSLISTMKPQFEAAKNAKIDKSGPWTRSEQARLIRSLLDPSKFDEQAALAYKAKLEQRLQDLGGQQHSEAKQR